MVACKRTFGQNGQKIPTLWEISYKKCVCEYIFGTDLIFPRPYYRKTRKNGKIWIQSARKIRHFALFFVPKVAFFNVIFEYLLFRTVCGKVKKKITFPHTVRKSGNFSEIKFFRLFCLFEPKNNAII